MKTLLLLLAVAVSFTVFGEEPPSWARGGTVTFTDRNGVVYSFKAEEFKIVKRRVKEEPKESPKPKVVLVEKAERLNSRLGLHVGFGPQGLQQEEVDGAFKISQKYKPVIGLSFQREIKEGMALGGTVLSNETFTLDVNLDLN